MKLSYRDRVKLLGSMGVGLGLRAGGLATLAGWAGTSHAQPEAGGTLRWALTPEPPTLVTAFNSAQMVQQISAKMMDGLVAYDRKLDPTPALATAWTVSDDARTVTFKLRANVKWHDGAPFTSADVKYTFEELLKKHHPRGRATFANLEQVETPDRLTAIFRLSKPSAYMMAALSASESPILPKHLFEKGDPTTSPLLAAPVGTGPFKFGEWQRGKFLRLVRNPDYWVKGQPHFDSLIVRFIPDAGARAVALETGELDISGGDPVPLADLKRLDALPSLEITTEGYSMFGAMYYFEFNMRDPQFKDVRVRQAIAHAIDRDFVARNTWFGYASAATGPISNKQPKFHSDNVPKYAFNTKRADELLDQAGFRRQANGIRFRISHDPASGSEEYRRFGEYFKQAMKAIGIDVDLRVSDAGTYQRRIWTDNAFQTTSYGIFTMPDPTIGVQRVYWSKNIRKGVPYSNGSGYTSPEMDALLEAAQTERDPQKRRETFHRMQAVAMTDLPIIPIINRFHTSVYNRRLAHFTEDVEGVFGTFAAVSRTAK
jgi:peptide/nickel transport system substrate-binding protein